ncbi:preprotein translocase subunit Sec63 [Streptomyces phaeochromogenes]|nr:preprotein translocase subunit Sec63 [Streptomyces phaeochromogenes]
MGHRGHLRLGRFVRIIGIHLPYFSGRWIHCDPVWNLKAIASITCRWSRH